MTLILRMLYGLDLLINKKKWEKELMLRFNKEQKHTLKIKLSPYLYLIKKYKLKYDSISIMPYLGKVVVQFHNYHNPKIKGLCSHEFDEREFKGLKIETYLTYQLKPLLED